MEDSVATDAIDLADAVNPIFLEQKNVQKSFWIDKKKYSAQQSAFKG